MLTAIVSLVTADLFAQRSKRTRRAVAMTNAQIVDKGAKDVGIQLKNISKYVYVLGGIATGIEDIDKEVRAGTASRQTRLKNEEYKRRVQQSIADLRRGLVKLEVDFRSKAPLRRYFPKLDGIRMMSFRAEDLANAGRFRDSGKELLLIIEKLTDTLVEMP